MSIEKWDILNENGVPTGKTTLRGHCFLKPGEYHLVVHIWILSSNGSFLIQRRSDNKKLMPGEWAATGGAAIASENSYQAAHRELFEEMGIKSTRENMKLLTRIRRRNSLLDVWAITTDVLSDGLRLQKSEVAEAKWVSASELKSMIEDGRFHNYGKEYFELVFDKLEEYRGAIV